MSIFLLLLFTALSAFFSGTEIAFFSLPASKIRAWKRASDAGKRCVYHVLSQPRTLLVLIFMLDTIVNILLQNTASGLFGVDEDIHGPSFFGKIVLPLLLILVCGELVPKWYAMRHNQKIAIFSSQLYQQLLRLFSSIQRTVTAISELLSRTIFFFLKPEPPLSTREVEEIMTHAVRDGILQNHEALLISNWIDLERKMASDVMIPRSQVPVFSSQSLQALKKNIRGALPLRFRGVLIGASPDTPEGFILFSDLFFLTDESHKITLEKAQRQIFYIPETLKLRKLIQEFEERKSSIACVVDEHGTVVGYLNFEEIENRLIRRGSVEEEYKSTSGLHIISPTSLVVVGTVPIEKIAAFFGTTLTSRYKSTTISGWLIEQLDSVPKVGVQYTHDNLLFQVLSSTPRRIEKVFIQLRKK